MSTHQLQQLTLPDFKKMCPWTSSINPHYETAGLESANWIESFGIFQGAKRAQYRAAAADLLAARTYPYAGYEDYRTACDFLHLLFIHDEVCDELDGPAAARTGDKVLQVMKKEVSAGSMDVDSPLIRLVQEWRERFYRKDIPNAQKRFMEVFSNYLDAVSHESELRDHKHIITVDEYPALRREFSGTQPAFAMFQYIHGINLSAAVFQDLTFMTLYWAAVDMVNISNDVYSYKVEYAHGLDGSNLITLLMHNKGIKLQEAVNKIGERFNNLVEGFCQGKAHLPSFTLKPGGYEGIDEDVAKFVQSLEQWVIGNLYWSFETPRYFGPEREEVARTLVVNIPSETKSATKPFRQD